MTKYIGKISEANIGDDNIKWLVLEPHVHKNSTVGYYMFFHENINQPAVWDNWYQSLEIAFEAGKDYGIKKEDWQAVNSN